MGFKCIQVISNSPFVVYEYIGKSDIIFKKLHREMLLMLLRLHFSKFNSFLAHTLKKRFFILNKCDAIILSKFQLISKIK